MQENGSEQRNKLRKKKANKEGIIAQQNKSEQYNLTNQNNTKKQRNIMQVNDAEERLLFRLLNHFFRNDAISYKCFHTILIPMMPSLMH